MDLKNTSVEFCTSADDLLNFVQGVEIADNLRSNTEEVTAINCDDTSSDTDNGKSYLNLNEESLSEDEKKHFESTWMKRKLLIEQTAQVRALTTFNKNQREKKSLEEVIDASLKEYADMYEKAQTVKLQFEAEKNDWSKKLRQSMCKEFEAISSRKRPRDNNQDRAIRSFQQLNEEASQDFQYFSQQCHLSQQVSSAEQVTREVSSVAMDADVATSTKFSVLAQKLDEQVGRPSTTTGKRFLIPLKSANIAAIPADGV